MKALKNYLTEAGVIRRDTKLGTSECGIIDQTLDWWITLDHPSGHRSRPYRAEHIQQENWYYTMIELVHDRYLFLWSPETRYMLRLWNYNEELADDVDRTSYRFVGWVSYRFEKKSYEELLSTISNETEFDEFIKKHAGELLVDSNPKWKVWRTLLPSSDVPKAVQKLCDRLDLQY